MYKRGVQKWCTAGVLSIVGGFMLHLTLGTLYCFGNLNTYITSYVRKHVPGQVKVFSPKIVNVLIEGWQ